MIIGTIQHANKNNLLAGSESIYGLAIEPLVQTWTWFDWTFQFSGVNGSWGNDSAGMIAALLPRTGISPPFVFSVNECPLSVEWTRQIPAVGPGAPLTYTGLPGTVTEIWKSFGVEIAAARRLDVDPGFSVGSVRRAGPRYRLLLAGSEYRGRCLDSDRPDVVVASPAGGFPFPLRLAIGITKAVGIGVMPALSIANIVVGGKTRVSAIYSARDKAVVGGSGIHLRIYQKSRYAGIADGIPVDYDS
jgi:hypothetical protein